MHAAVGWRDGQRSLLCAARGRDQFQVFAINCAHLGCPVRWFPQSQLFMCPCHGGVYYADGSRASGPPERGLFTYDYQMVGGTVANPCRADAEALQHRRSWSRSRSGRKGDCHAGDKRPALKRSTTGSSGGCSSKGRSRKRPCTRCRATQRAGGTSSAARRSRFCSCRS